jgi:hypothetical protein
MSTSGFDHHYVETHDWKKAVAFWQRLGFELEFVAEQSIEDPLATEMYLGANADYVAPDGVDVVSPFVDTHWGTKVMVIQDPDGHRYRIQAPVSD